jgi:hypothetical protein
MLQSWARWSGRRRVWLLLDCTGELPSVIFKVLETDLRVGSLQKCDLQRGMDTEYWMAG